MGLWLAVIVLIAYAMIVDWTNQDRSQPLDAICLLQVEKQPIWGILNQVLCIFVPFAVVVLSPVPMLWKLRMRRRVLSQTQKAPRSTVNAIERPDGQQDQERNNDILLGLSSICFLLCYGPVDVVYAILIGYGDLNKIVPDLSSVTAILTSCNCILNAFIYQFSNMHIRKAVLRAFCGKNSRQQETSSTVKLSNRNRSSEARTVLSKAHSSLRLAETQSGMHRSRSETFVQPHTADS